MGGGGSPPPWDPGNADSYKDRALFASVALSSLSSLLSFLVSRTILTSFSRPWDPKNILNPCRGSSNSRFLVFWHWHAPQTQKIIQTAPPGTPQSTQNLTQKGPRSSQGRPESAQGAALKRPNRTLRRPGSLWESFRAPQDLILELLKLTLLYLWDPPATQQRMPVLCSLLALLSPLLSPSWVLGPDARPANFDPGT